MTKKNALLVQYFKVGVKKTQLLTTVLGQINNCSYIYEMNKLVHSTNTLHQFKNMCSTPYGTIACIWKIKYMGLQTFCTANLADQRLVIH